MLVRFADMPLSQSWLDWEDASGGRAILKGTPETIKGMYDQLVQALIPMMPAPNENVDVAEGDVDGIKYRTYVPKKGDGPFPIGIWTHGGGYMTGDLNSDELLCRACWMGLFEMRRLLNCPRYCCRRN